MVLTIISVWLGAIVIGATGAAAALAQRWLRVLLLIIVAAIYSLALFDGLRGDLAVALLAAGDAFVWLTMLGPVVMWSIFAAGTSVAMWRQHTQAAAS